MPYIGEANIDESWKNVVTEFVPNLVEGTTYRIIYSSIRGGEYIRQAANPGNALKGHGVPLSGEREITVEAGVGIWMRSFSGQAQADGRIVVETA